MKFFTNKKFLFKLIVSICIFLTLFNFVKPPKSQADAGALLAAAGGKLLDPIVDLVLVIGDGIMEVFQTTIMGRESSTMYDNAKEAWWSKALKVLAFVVIFALVCVATAGVGALAACIPLIGGVIASGITSGVVVFGLSIAAFSAVSGAFFEEVIVLPTYYIGPEEIFSGKILLFDVNIFNPKELYVSLAKIDDKGNIVVDSNGNQDIVELTSEEWNEQKKSGQGTEITSGYQEQYYFYYDDGEIVRTSVNSTAQDVKDIIARWYYIIRNIAIVGLMLVLLYVGIRMLITSISSEKAKYKQMLSDWLIALCLVFLMQYIMVFANEFVEGVTKILSSAANNNGQVAVITDPPDKLVTAIGEDAEIDGQKIIEDGNINWPTNLMGRMRVLAQQKDGTSGYIGYAICFIVLVMFTVFFVITYLKRLLYVLFLTVIAPFVAMTYPIDKLRDGKAQAFDMWFKEYTCNLMIQPFHLLLYTIFVTMAFELAGSNVIYSLVVLGFMMPAEKFLRKMFGFDRASSPGFLDGAAGAAMTMTAINSLSKIGGKSRATSKNVSNNGGSDNDNKDYLNRGKSKSVQELLNDMSRDGENNDKDQPKPPPTEDKENDKDKENKTRLLDPDDEEDRREKERQEELEKDREEREAAIRQQEERENEEEQREKEKLEEEDEQRQKEKLEEEEEQRQKERLEEEEEQREKEKREKELETQAEEESKLKKATKGQYIKNAAKIAFVKPIKRGWANKGKNFKNNYKASAGNGIRFAAKLAGTGAAAIAAGSAGIASGSLGNVAKYTAAGAVAGNALGTGVSNMAIDKVTSQAREFKEDTLKETYGEKFSEYEKLKKDEIFMKDKETRELFARELGLKKKADIDAAMLDAIKYRQYGVEDNDIIIKAMTMNNGNPSNRANIERIGAARLSMSSKSLKDLDATMKRFAETPGISKEKIEEMKNNIRKINNL